MRLAVGLVVRACLPLAKGESVSQCCPTRSDVHRAATSEIKGRQVVQPAIGVPRPASDGAVYDGSPEEPEDEGRDDASTLEGPTDHDLHGAGAEEKLVEAERDVRDRGVANRGGRHNVAQAEVGKVTDKRACRAAVRQREAPEHPLERDDRTDHERLEEEGERRFSAGETSVEKTDSGYDQPYYEATEDQVRVVVLVAHVLGVHVHFERVAARGHGFVVARLFEGVNISMY